MPGWTEWVEPVRVRSIFRHNIGLDCGRLRRRRVKQDEQTIVKQRFAEAILIDRSKDCWAEMRTVNGNKASPVSVVDDVSNAQ